MSFNYSVKGCHSKIECFAWWINVEYKNYLESGNNVISQKMKTWKKINLEFSDRSSLFVLFVHVVDDLDNFQHLL